METLITAKNATEFTEIGESLKSLRPAISEQVEKAERNLLGLDYTLKQSNLIEPIIYVPRDVKNIKQFGYCTIVYCEGYILRIVGELNKKNLQYMFIDPNEKEYGQH